MAQQKILVALCLFGAVACASAQMFDYQACTRAVRYEAERYRETLTSSAQRFTQSLQQTGAQALDTSQFQKDMDKITQSISSMADLSKGVDMSRWMSMYLENIQTVSSMMTSSMRMSLMTGAMREYIDFGGKIYTASTEYLDRVTQSCLPANKRIYLPA